MRDQQIKDLGPYYHEFASNGLLKEPWNAISSLIFFVPVIFWLIKLKGELKHYPIFIVLLPILFLNGLGSTLYHAFRSHDFFFYLDALPAAIMGVTLAVYFWIKVYNAEILAIITVTSIYGAGFLIKQWIMSDDDLSEWGPNVLYFFAGTAFLLPVIIILIRTRFYKSIYVVVTILTLITALLFRMADHPSPNYFKETIPQGLHFLWHIFSAIATFTMGYYVYFLQNREEPFTPNQG